MEGGEQGFSCRVHPPSRLWFRRGRAGGRGMGMHYKCIKAVEQKAYCLFIYLIGSNYAAMYSERNGNQNQL